MKQVLAIMALAIRNAFRSRVVLSLLVLLGLVVAGLPATIRGDGTLEGHVQILLTYTLGITSVILTLATLWAGCAALSVDIDEKVIQLIATKPVPRFRIWLGKWLGLVVINALLLALCGLTVYCMLFRTSRSSVLSEDDRTRLRTELLVARRSVSPPAPDVEAAAEAQVRQAIEQGMLTEGIAPDDAMRAVRQQLTLQALTVRSGSHLTREIALPRPVREDETLLLRYTYGSSRGDGSSVAGVWTIGTPDNRNAIREQTRSVPGGFHTLQVSGQNLAGATTLIVDFANVDADAASVVFAADNGLSVFMKEGGFEANLTRALLVLIAHLAFVGALGVTMGCMFSMPVATFISLFFLTLIHLGGYLESMASQSVLVPWHAASATGASWLDATFRAFFQAMHFIVKPFQMANPLELIATGTLVDWTWVAQSFAVQTGLYGLALALLGTYILNRRELALPAT